MIEKLLGERHEIYFWNKKAVLDIFEYRSDCIVGFYKVYIFYIASTVKPVNSSFILLMKTFKVPVKSI